MLDMDQLRMGKVLEVADMLMFDSCHHYIRDMPNKDDIYFINVAMGGI